MSQNKIRLTLYRIRSHQYILLKYPFDRKFIDAAKAFGTARSPDLRAWYVAANRRIHDIRKHFEPQFILDCSSLPLAFRVSKELNQSHLKLIDKFTMYLRGSRYSRSTISTYRNWIIEFLFFHRTKSPERLTMKDVHQFNHQVILERRYSVSSQRQFIEALKLFFTHTCPNGPAPEALEQPRKDYRLPEVLSKREIAKILSNTANLKHKLILSLLYSCGLRVGELISLKRSDIDFERQLVRVRMSKGRKDRYVRLGGAVHTLILHYLKRYQPSKYLIEGPSGKNYSSSSIRKILKRSCKASGIIKKVTPHTLRHSYATHMLELAVDIRYIQAMLGHRRPETTMIYTHISTHKIEDLPNPFDELVREQQERDKRNAESSKIPLIPGKLWGY